MGAIIEAVQTQGPLAVQAASTVVSTGAALGVDAVSCSSQVIAAGVASSSVTATVNVSVTVSASAGGPSS
jgi:hypothetical protein